MMPSLRLTEPRAGPFLLGTKIGLPYQIDSSRFRPHANQRRARSILVDCLSVIREEGWCLGKGSEVHPKIIRS